MTTAEKLANAVYWPSWGLNLGAGVVLAHGMICASWPKLTDENPSLLAPLNFMGAQDVMIGGALLIGFSALIRASSLFCGSKEDKAASSKYFALAGAMLMTAGLYALTVGIFANPVPNSKIGNFDHMNTENASMFGLAFSALIVIGAALVGAGYKTAPANTFNISFNICKNEENNNNKNLKLNNG